MEGLPEFSVLTHTVGIATDVYDVTVVQDAVDESCRYHLVAKHLAPHAPGSTRWIRQPV
jgi:hypothetical protein